METSISRIQFRIGHPTCMPSGLHPDAFAKRGNPGISVKTSIHVPEKKNTSKKTAAWNLIRFQHPNQQIFKKPYSYLSKLTARPKKYYSKALLWLRSLHKKTCWMVQKYPILKTPVFPWRIISPMNCIPGFIGHNKSFGEVGDF